MSIKETFSRNLRHMRTDARMSIQDVAAELDIEISRYRMWESGTSLPRYECLIAISQLFGISIDCILTVNLAMVDLGKCKS